jgi:hypothetical protein
MIETLGSFALTTTDLRHPQWPLHADPPPVTLATPDLIIPVADSLETESAKDLIP